ncbi:VWA domain-containing protein [Actinoplanes cyaneus]|uniref:VWA domain-containing protein n=2 Tax=Actinoplanes cyaneus TaxID=52696 RepID=A0A919IG08_9ACTN|nr:von Willebrand factor type A domain-containing protein [Actinoplanes cyaneus]GID64501.1 VWA domain-containing protein [Actinoplanes cyaneus]
MAIVVVVAGTWFGYSQMADSKCTGSVRLSVAAAPEIAPAVTSAADAWSKDGGNVNGTCVSVAVSPVAPSEVASVIARDHGVTLAGVGQPSGTVQVPDVWIPDSSTWQLRLRNEASGFQPNNVTSVAQSPLVVAMPKPIAQSQKLEGQKVPLASLLTAKALGSADAPKFGIVNPGTDASGLIALMAIGQAVGTGADAVKSQVQALTYLSKNRSALRDELLERFPKSADAATIAEGLGAAPLSEEDVISYNAKRPPVELSAVYLSGANVPLDYPFTVLPQVVDGDKISAAAGLLKQLTTGGFKEQLSTAGLRAPDGTYGSGFVAPAGAPQASPAITAAAGGGDNTGGTAAAGVDAASVSKVVGTWNATTQAGRVLAVFDVSGSMGDPVPTANNLSRAVVTQKAAATGLELFSDEWAVGVWAFSTDMNGKKPWKELIKITPLSTGRQDVRATIPQLNPKSDGNTGLYDTVLDAYNAAKANWKPGKVNSVILFTDGENDNPDGIKQDELINKLKAAQDSSKFVRLVLIGIGNEVNKAELQTISKTVKGSGLFIAEDPTKITDIFLQAIGSRTGVE